jgi:hypothetical protein
MTQPTPASEDKGRETRIVDVKGRSIVVRQLLDAQMLFMAREGEVLQDPDVPIARKMKGMRRLFDALESQVVQDEDREYLMDLISTGNLELKDLMSFVSAFVDQDEVEKPKVRRGRRPAVR